MCKLHSVAWTLTCYNKIDHHASLSNWDMVRWSAWANTIVSKSITDVFLFKGSESKREQFRRYLEKTGVMDGLTNGNFSSNSTHWSFNKYVSNNFIFWFLLQCNKASFFIPNFSADISVWRNRKTEQRVGVSFHYGKDIILGADILCHMSYYLLYYTACMTYSFWKMMWS